MENSMEVPQKSKNKSGRMIQHSHSWAYIPRVMMFMMCSLFWLCPQSRSEETDQINLSKTISGPASLDLLQGQFINYVRKF